MKKLFIIGFILLVLGIFNLIPQGIPTAICLAIAALMIDCGVQFWRNSLFRTGGNILALGVIGGLSIRMINLMVCIQIARLRLDPDGFYIFGAILLTIPVWSFIPTMIKPTGRM